MMRWVVLYGGPIQLFLVPACVPLLVQQRLWYVLSCMLGDRLCVVYDYNHLLDLAEYSKNDKSVKK